MDQIQGWWEVVGDTLARQNNFDGLKALLKYENWAVQDAKARYCIQLNIQLESSRKLRSSMEDHTVTGLTSLVILPYIHPLQIGNENWLCSESVWNWLEIDFPSGTLSRLKDYLPSYTLTLIAVCFLYLAIHLIFMFASKWLLTDWEHILNWFKCDYQLIKIRLEVGFDPSQTSLSEMWS